MSKSTLEIVQDVFAEKLKIDASKVAPEASIASDLGADSLDAIEIIIGLEEIYNMEIEPEQAEGLVTVGNVVDLIDSIINQ